MDITIHPRLLQGTLRVIPSKSQAHRLLICAALADGPTTLLCPETNRDMEATAQCLCAMGAKITRSDLGYHINPIVTVPRNAVLHCHDSGSTLRFLLPILGALGISATIHMEGRLPSRPLSPLWEELERMGCHLSRPSPTTIAISGALRPGNYTMDGSVSSQYITGLYFALPLLDGPSHLTITGQLESRPYIRMTLEALRLFGVDPQCPGPQVFHSPGTLTVEGDWSNAAFFFAANSLGNALTVQEVDPHSPQGDKAVLTLLPQLEAGTPTLSTADFPDLTPILAVVAAAKHGAVFTHIQRLRLKESDRVASILAMLHALGGRAEATEDTLTVFGTGLTGGTVNSENDHRITMAAAIAATVCTQSVTITGAECVQKSYPNFFAEYRRLGGSYEQHLR